MLTVDIAYRFVFFVYLSLVMQEKQLWQTNCSIFYQKLLLGREMSQKPLSTVFHGYIGSLVIFIYRGEGWPQQLHTYDLEQFIYGNK